jgi:hypothetical protein
VLQSLRVPILNLPAGSYTVDWWDTTLGVVTRTDHLTAGPNGLILTIASLASDVAAQGY